MKKIVFIFLLYFSICKVAIACAPYGTPLCISQTFSGGNLNLVFTNTTNYNCCYTSGLELICIDKTFTGIHNYVGPTICKPNTNNMNYTISIPITGLCAGATYKFRVKDCGDIASGACSNWSSICNVTIPGPPLSVIITSADLSICPPASTILTASVTGGCGAISYSWSPGGGTSSSITVAPVVSTSYAVTVSTACFTPVFKSVTVTIDPDPIPGTAVATPTNICSGETTTLSLTGYAGSIQWQTSGDGGGTWTNISGANATPFTTSALSSNGTLPANTCFRAEVTGCGPAVYSNMVCVIVNPAPSVTASSQTICSGYTTNVPLTSNFAGTTFSWTVGASGVTGASNNSGIIIAQTLTTIGTSAAGLATYTITPRANNCNGLPVTVVVTVNPPPVPSFTINRGCPAQATSFGSTSSTGTGSISTLNWSFPGGMPSTGTGNNTSSTYPSGGTYSVSLVATSNQGCIDSTTQFINLPYYPVANFSTTSVCQSSATAFTDLSTFSGSITAWEWDFTNDGSIDNVTNAPTNIYPTSGTFSASLIVTDNNNCKDTVVLPLNVWGHSVPDFTASIECFGATTSFTNLTTTTNPNTGGVLTYNWNFNDGTANSNATNPTHTYTSSINGAIFNVTLTAISVNNCIDNSIKTVKINAIPTVTFTPINTCLNTNVVLNNSSNIALPDNISSYAWNFGTGSAPTSTSILQHPLLTYNSTGIKIITLTITANTTCSASITNTVVIYPQPVANFSATSVCQLTATAFTDLSTPTGSITAWAWDFTNNGSVDNATNAPANVYLTSGTFITSLIVTSNNNCQDTIALPLNVWGHTIPNFTPDKVCFGTSTVFTNLTDETTNTNVGLGTMYLWNFADGSATTNLNGPTHTYTLGGNANAAYNVTLTATSLHNCIDNVVKVVNVYALPTASFTSDSVCLGSSSQMNDATNGNGNVVNTYAWDFLSDGSVDVSGVPNPNFTFPAIGNNNVTYTASTLPVAGLVCSNTTNAITVWVNPNPIPDFTFVDKCVNAQPNTFNGTPSTIAIGANTAYAWAYGDGSISIPTLVSTSTHTYAAAGVYNVTLTVTSNKGCQTAIAKQVEVYQKSLMRVANSSVCDRTATTFTAVSLPNSGTVISWFWDFNNVISTIEANGQTSGFTFLGPGTHSVTLISETNHGCKDTLTHAVYVNYVPAPLFNVDLPIGCPLHCVNFTDATLPIPGPGQLTKWQWTLGDGTIVINATNSTVSHCYTNSSSNQFAQYDVNLVVTTDSGCVKSINKLNHVKVYPKPIANYTVNPNPGNIFEPLEYFINQSLDYTKWWWTFGDNTPNDSVNVSPAHFYNEIMPATYYSHLMVANKYGCLDTAYVPVEIGPYFTFYIPNAFSPSNDDGVNDYFNGKGIGIAEYEMWIFDRWGEEIFYTDDIEKGWNGIVQGKSGEGKQDIYIWKVELKDAFFKKHYYTGHVTLLK